jgi:hypothetical protein
LLVIPEPLLSLFHELFPFRLQLHLPQQQADDEQGKLYPEMIVQMVIIAIAIMTADVEPHQIQMTKNTEVQKNLKQSKILNTSLPINELMKMVLQQCQPLKKREFLMQ